MDTPLIEIQSSPLRNTLIENEPLLHSASIDFASRNGGPLTRAFLTAVESQFGMDGIDHGNIVIDTRSHFLLPGQYPCIPGWHCDARPREDIIPSNQLSITTSSQPKLGVLDSPIRNYIAVLGDVSPTQFLEGDASQILTSRPPTGEDGIESQNRYAYWNSLITERISTGFHAISQLIPGAIVEFDINRFHRGVPALTSGFRWFARLTTHYYSPPTPKIRRFSQVFLPSTNQGW